VKERCGVFRNLPCPSAVLYALPGDFHCDCADGARGILGLWYISKGFE